MNKTDRAHNKVTTINNKDKDEISENQKGDQAMAKNNNNLKEHERLNEYLNEYEEPKEYKGTDMESEIRAIEELINDSKEVKTSKSNTSKYVSLGLWSIGAVLISSETLAVFDVGVAVKDAVDPLKAAIIAYGMAFVGICGIFAAFVTPGDFRQKFLSAAISLIIAGIVVTGAIKGFLT